MSWNLHYQGREITIEVEPIEVTVTRWRAVVVDGDEREPIPYTTSDDVRIAEGLGAMAMVKLGASACLSATALNAAGGGYQPTHSTLDPSDPPQGGSGVLPRCKVCGTMKHHIDPDGNIVPNLSRKEGSF